jgi:hypothetical protein
MKTYKVYEIINHYGTVEYVGETTKSLDHRFRQHVKCVPSPGKGKFYNRQDVIIYEVAQFTTRKEARYLEEQLQLEYGLETDRLKLTNNSTFKSGPNNPVIKKLNDIDRVNIRLLYNTGNYTRKELSLQYNVSETTIYHIIKNKIQNL